MASVDIVWPSPETCDAALALFARHHLSHSIGLLDALIGQTAVALALPLHTFNRKHYKAIPHLLTVEPYSKT
ncbi:MAG TPA: toxin-antitoxin system, toxin component [Chloroflexota bacterium]|nr:toxin-antitoxin system, toxin component [Chloroflexota bacterium]HUM70284.1 toxin-antitoxin system, toxin component [Chloroflexota bacterium]